MSELQEEKPEKTPEELAEIAYLDKLRSCEGEAMPVGLPLACVVKVVAYEEVPKANEQYALVTVEGRDGRTWRLCVRRYYLEEGAGVPCGGAPLYSTKLQYANVRVTMAKTPSDYRANLNNGNEIANKCF